VIFANLPKPPFGQACNGCGYCCSVEPCLLAKEFLHCSDGPCIALEVREGRTVCGLVRNPLGYLFKAAHPDAEVPLLDDPPEVEQGHELSVQFAAALGLGKGCDADDDDESSEWSARVTTPTSSSNRTSAQPHVESSPRDLFNEANLLKFS
jgi:hypothetical protein